MKIQRALILPVLLLIAITQQTELRGQAPTIQAYGAPAGPQTPLGIPTYLGAPQNVQPTGYASPGGPRNMSITGMPRQMGGPIPGPMPGSPGGPMVGPMGAQMGPGMGGPGMGGPMMGPGMGGQMMGGPGMGGPMMGPGMGGQMMGGPGMGGPMMGPGMGGPGMGGPVMPAQYSEPVGGGGGIPQGGYSQGGFVEGGRGWRLFDRAIDAVMPHDGGGWCEPRWFDFSVEALYLSRDDASRRVNLVSDGVAGMAPPQIVLSTDNLAFDDAAGFRATGAIQFGASSLLEISYAGSVNQSATAQVTSGIDNLFSAYSQFGNAPSPSVGPPITVGGFLDSDSGDFARIDYSSNFDTIELDFRRRWMGPNCRIQGSWLAGVRYFLLEEHFNNFISVNYPDPNAPNPQIVGFTNYSVETVNSMTGFQLGGDMWTTLVPGIRLGMDAKTGIYYNRAEQATLITATSIPAGLREAAKEDVVAFVAEANLMGIYRLNENFSLKLGAQLLFADGVALAPENFNAGPPFVAGARTVGINSNGQVFYHGVTGGFEWMW